LRDDVIEIRDVPPPPAQPSDWWDPVLRLGAKKGESWTSEMPDGRSVTYTVVEFRQDERRNQLVEIRRVVKNPKEPAAWEESLVTYALGIGEIRRQAVKRNVAGGSMTMLESRLVSAAVAPPPSRGQDAPEKKRP
jgi:hypothetical protein